MKLLLLMVALLLSSAASGSPWTRVESLPAAKGKRVWIQPQNAQFMKLNMTDLLEELEAVPMEASKEALALPCEIHLPDRNGDLHRFFIEETEVMHPDLAAKYPEIRTFVGRAVGDVTSRLRMDVTPDGVHAQVMTPDETYYVDPCWKGDRSYYSCYRKADLPGKEFVCGEPRRRAIEALPRSRAARSNGTSLRTYRLAVTAQGEYTVFHGGSAAAMAAIVTTINRVNGILELDLAVRLQLIANNNLIVYPNPATDPFTNNDSSGTTLDENQSNTDSVIGNGNYDIGHIFNTGGGGLAGVGVVCFNPQKAEGATGSSSPEGDPFDVDFVAHEIGHQLGANHTFNGNAGSCNGSRAASVAYEPGSGTTIMGYAGICGSDNIQNHADPYFHAGSINEILTYLDSESCEVSASTGNTIPTVSAGSDYTIPHSTPFTLTASGTDANGDTLTYCWEQYDLGPAQSLSASDNGSSPLFRSRPPTISPSRTFPELADILSNTSSDDEELPSQAQTMNFRVTARDNRANGGGIHCDDMQVTVVAGSPFQLTFPNTAVTLFGSQNVTWNTANTQNAPVSTANVNIRLSTDGGQSFPTILAANVPNDGSQSVTLPNLNSTQARIKIEGAGNIFFDVSNTDFTIQPDPALPNLIVSGVLVAENGLNNNGNGVIDPGESGIGLVVTVENQGSTTATGISASLVSLSPHATVTSGSASYPDLPASGTATNSVLFQVDLAGSHPCGEDLSFRLDLSSNEITTDTPFIVPVGSSTSPATSSYSASEAITQTTFDVTFAVSASGILQDVDFRLDGSICSTDPNSALVGLNHSWVGDLILTLISPSGTEVPLMSNPGGGSFGSQGSNFCQTRFDDDSAAASIQNIAENGSDAPHTGIYSPASPLSAFDGEEVNGSWKLRITDTESEDNGRLNAFSLIYTLVNCAAPVTNVYHTLTPVPAANGTINPGSPVQVLEGDDQPFSVQAAAYYHVSQVITNMTVALQPGPGNGSVTFTYTNVMSDGGITAVFAENLALHDTPEWWLAQHGLTNGTFDSEAGSDQDFDGMLTWQEFRAGTIPTNANSVLSVGLDGGRVLSWKSVAGKLYTLRHIDDLNLSVPTVIASNLVATPPVNLYTNSAAGAQGTFFVETE